MATDNARQVDVKTLISDLAEKIGKTANVKAVFGEPEHMEGITIIPVASVECKGGGGGGFGNEKGAQEKAKGAKGVGGGGGLKVSSHPVGYIEVSEDKAKFVEIVDKTKLASRAIPLGIALGGLALVLGYRLVKGKKKK